MFTKWNQRLILLLAALLVMSGAAFAATQGSQDNVWERIDKSTLPQRGIDNVQMPSSFETFRLNKAAIDALLKAAPEEYSTGQAVILSLPMPDGSIQRFEVEHSLVVERGLLEKYPELGATYRGRGIDDPTAYVRFDLLPSGFHSMIISTAGTVIVDPYAKGNTDNYISYFKHDRPSPGPINCEVKGDDSYESVTNAKGFAVKDVLPGLDAPEVTSGTQLRTYRLALAANNEYCTAVGGNTVAGSLAAMVLIMNRVNGVYEKDLGIHMNMVANNNLVVYAGDNLTCPVPGGTTACTAANDPYGNDTSALDQNTPNLNAVIGAANYDIGHVFTTGSGGVAQLAVPCGGSKGAGTTGLPNPVGDDFAIDYVAHEMGHQWSANHTFNGNVSNCSGGNRSAGSAYEPGSGITIMAYAGICGNQDLAQHSIDTFHVKSLESIVAYSQNGAGNACAVTTASGNTPPTVTTSGNFNIPKQTAFALTATASDVNPGDAITYDWQEYDLGAATTTVPNTDADGIKPIFRPYLPTTSGTRFFPSMQYILTGGNVPPASYNCGRGVGMNCLTGEILPSVARTMTFQVVARDNHIGTGGINTANSIVTVSGTSGPFNVTSPNTAVSYPGNSFQTITWDVANTSSAPINATNVKISLSTDGGTTFPTVLAASTANDGTEDLLIPNTPSTTARIKVEAVGNIFFDISNTNFNITAGATGTPTPTATSTGSVTPTNTATATATSTPIACGSWIAGPQQPAARYALQGVLGSDNKFYVAGGQSADQTPVISNQLARYDPATNSWTDMAPMPVAISQGTMGAANGKIYVAGGYTGGTTVVTSLRIYDIATNTWTTGADLPTAVEAASGAVVNGKFYVMGGDDFNAAVNTTYIYNIATNTWTTGATLPDLRTNSYATAASNGMIYLYGGLTGASFTATDTLLRYDPVANSWTNLGTAGTGGNGNYGGISPYGTGKLLITVGATTAYVASNTTRIFDIAAGTFSAGPAMLTARAGHAQGTLADGRVIVVDGLDTAATTTSNVELIGPCGLSTPTNTPTNTPTATNTGTATATATPTGTSSPSCTPNVWQAGPAQAPARYAIQGVVGTDGKVYVAGGQSIDATPILSNQFVRFNPATNAWENLANLPVAVGQASMGAANGKIYVAGGFTGGTTVVNTLRIYDIATNTWTTGANMPAAKEAAAGAVVNGKFYVMGGDDFNNGVATNYIYDIAANTWTSGTVVPDARTNTYATSLNGLVYVYGGVNIVSGAFVTTDTLLRYDPVANTWTNLGSAGTSGLLGNYGAVSPIGSGQLLISDGADASGVSSTATHVFTISSGTFSAGPAMTEARAGHAQATLPDGRVIVVDGFNGTFATTGVELLTGSCASTTPTSTPTASATSTSTSTPIMTPTGGTATATPTVTATPTASPSATPLFTFANTTPICTQLGTAGAPYPSSIQVAGGPNQIDGVRVTLFNITHQLPDNMDFLLVGPNGQKFILMADAGGAIPVPSPGVTLTFVDSAGVVVPDSGPLTTGNFEPTSWEPGQTSFPAPAPPAPYNEPGSTVGGTGTQTLNGNFRLSNSNGTWSLYMRDDGGLFESPTAITGCVNGGWQIQFVPTTAAGIGISGRVMTAGGQGIRNATVVVTGNSLAEPIVTQTGSFGFYSLEGLRAGETYVVTVNSRRYTFSMPSRVVSLIDNVVDADFIANSQ